MHFLLLGSQRAADQHGLYRRVDVEAATYPTILVAVKGLELLAGTPKLKATKHMTFNPSATTERSRWIRSTRCTTATCVEARFSGESVDIRDSKQNHLKESQPSMTVAESTFQTFIRELLGEAPQGSNGEIAIDHLTDGGVAFRSLVTGVTLSYTADELEAFVAGARDGEFQRVLATA